jgi:heme/copper-type cytochrome/quinol oxidase subunit 4
MNIVPCSSEGIELWAFQVNPFIGVDNFTSRVEITLSLMLTAVAFKLATADLLPVLPYNTILGVHMLIGIITLGVMMLVCAIEEFMEVDQATDWCVQGILCAIWVLYHVLLMLGVERLTKDNADACGPSIRTFDEDDKELTAAQSLQKLLIS